MALLTIDIRSQGSIAAKPVQVNAALRAGFLFIGQAWHKRFKMLKFARGARSRYGLAPRSGEPGSGRKFAGSYYARKLAKGFNGDGVQALGEGAPFVWGGKSRNDARASTKVIATAKRGFGSADCIINAPTLNLRPKGGRINLRTEFERVVEEERRELEREGIEVYILHIEKAPGEHIRISA